MLIAVTFLVYCVAVVMTMTGRGGGNFYVPLLIACGLPMLQAATTSQFILLVTSLAAAAFFANNRIIDWKLALVIDPPTDIMAFAGGYYAHVLPSAILKLIFSILLVIAGFFMLQPVKERTIYTKNSLGYWHRTFGEYQYVVNLWWALPITAVAGFAAGMTGISGGSFKVPLMALICGVPIHIAIGTSTAMVAATAFMGILEHAAAGDFVMLWAVPLGVAAMLGGVTGARISLKTKSGTLKKVFAYTTFAAAFFMVSSVFI